LSRIIFKKNFFFKKFILSLKFFLLRVINSLFSTNQNLSRAALEKRKVQHIWGFYSDKAEIELVKSKSLLLV